MSNPAIADNQGIPPKATRREWLGLAVIALPCMLYSMDLTVLNLAIPAISADLRPTASQLGSPASVAKKHSHAVQSPPSSMATAASSLPAS